MLEGGMQFYRGDGAHPPLLNVVLTGRLAGRGILIDPGRLEVDHGQTLLVKGLQGGLPDLLTHHLDVRAVVLKLNVVVPEILLHGGGSEHLRFLIPQAIVEFAQGSGEDHSIKTAQRTLNLVFVFRDKLLHGVLLRLWV